MLPDTSRFRLAADRAVAKVIEDDAIVIDTITGRYYSLEGTGETAWSLLVDSHSLAEVADALRQRYDTVEADVVADVARLAEQLLEEKLLVPALEGAPSPPLPHDTGSRGPYLPPELTVFRDMEDLLAFDPPLPAADPALWAAGSEPDKPDTP